MKISRTLAQKIVSSIKTIINQELNYIDVNGNIIASTDNSRIGQKHGGALEVIRTGETITIKSDDEFTGAKKGVNMPINFKGEIIGVIGITGVPEEVSKYGYMLIHMTELLVKEAYLQELNFEKREKQRIIIENLIFNDTSYNSDDDVIQEIFEYDVHIPRRVVQAEIEKKEQLNPHIYDQIYEVIPDNTQNIFIVNDRSITLLLTITDEKELVNFLETLSTKMFKKYELHIIYGIGSICANKIETRSSYKEAQDSLKYSKLFSRKKIQFYSHSELGMLILPNLNTEGISYEQSVLGKLTEGEKEQYLNLLKVYEQCNGSITKCSQVLFVHKNTVQYRLDSIYHKTGYNPRQLKDYTTLKIAFMIYEMKKNVSYI